MQSICSVQTEYKSKDNPIDIRYSVLGVQDKCLSYFKYQITATLDHLYQKSAWRVLRVCWRSARGVCERCVQSESGGGANDIFLISRAAEYKLADHPKKTTLLKVYFSRCRVRKKLYE